MNRSHIVLLASLFLGGCIYSDVRGPLSYRSPTPGDVGGHLGGEAKGSACNTAILWLVAWGDGGYDAAMADAHATSKASLLADVKADTSYTNVFFGVYQRQCTTVNGRVATVAAAPSPVTTAPVGAAP